MISDFLTSEWGHLTSADGAECIILSLGQIFIDITSTGMPVSYSRPEKIVTVILMPRISLPKSTKPLIYLKTEPMDSRLVFGCLIMRPAIKSKHLMWFLPGRCQRIQMMDGHTIKVAPRCGQLLLLMDKYRNFTLQMIICNIRAFSKEWSKSFETADFGLNQETFLLNVRVLNVTLARWIAAAAIFYLTSLISSSKSLSWKSL